MKSNIFTVNPAGNGLQLLHRWKWPLFILLTLAMVATSILVRYSFFPPLAAADASTGQEVLQGEIPALGTVTLMFHPSGSIDGSGFGQRDGNWYRLCGSEDAGVIRVAVVAEQTDQTNGWLKLKWSALANGSVSGSWQSKNGKIAVPVTFQQVAQIWQVARHRPSSVLLEGVRVTEWTLYPVFYQHHHMEVITQALRRSWWHSLLGWEDFHVANIWKSWMDAEKFEPCELERHVQLLGVSDNLVSIFTCAGTEVQLDSSTRREMWNYVKVQNGYRRYYLKDLFRPGTLWEERLSSLCLKQLGPLPEQADQHHLTTAQMAEFATLPTGLMIQFDPYAFGVGSDNDFHVMIPWSSLQDVLAPSGPARFYQPAQPKAESRPVETACNATPFAKN